ncbi:MAG: purine-nucleoside phosphorylase [Erysipelotrichaceae bacterium]|nr:purine-nucleoside phosphorylase [Erysipelotrichaceae bacterium]MBR5049104.1 purine-nucleoside phosphorylase [Erysipelotrichaceae bacterium]
MSTPHNSAEKGDIAKLVLMPGDPLRAKVVAETYLDNPVQVNNVRGMLAYTGTYKGHRVTVMGSGMGMPSIGIYSYELYHFYDVEAIIRIGSTGAMLPEINLYDVILASAAFSESSYAYQQGGCTDKVIKPSEELNEILRKGAEKLGYPIVEGVVNSSDVFYYDESVAADRIANAMSYHTVCAEMESFALFHNANMAGKQAACLLTVSDSIVNHQETTAEERQNSFTRMMEIALQAAEVYD